MNITSIANSITAGRLTASKTTGSNQAASATSASKSADKVSQAFQQADRRLQQQRETASVQVSSFGKLKSSVSDVQTAAQSLTDTKKTSSDADLKKAAGNFVSSFNNATKAARAAATTQGAAAESNNARRAETDLRAAATGDKTLAADLKKIGITKQQDGSLAIDTKKFDAALAADPAAARSTLSKLGGEVEKTAARELSSTGTVGSSVSSLARRASNLEQQQNTQQEQAAAAQQSVSEQAQRVSAISSAGASGTASYQRIFSI